ncbi:hypothetical protein FQN54_008185 [Arachnomyces sp. PD_36]|nr:hypothetical protein FQN54_008185 [Arachnomyces sp. PD_36]
MATTMETTTTESKESAPSAPTQAWPPPPPIRILVQTFTHLVPGNGGEEKETFILDRICQHHWNRDFDPREFAYSSYNAKFAFNNRRCFFLVDYGDSTKYNNDDVPILSYEWTGESLKPMPELARDPRVLAKLKTDFSFTRESTPRKKRPLREKIKEKLYRDELILFVSEMNYLREHPEDIQWLKDNLRLRLWQKFVAEFNRRKGSGAPPLEE